MYLLHYLSAILLTAAAYIAGSAGITESIAIWEALIIGASVVTIGALIEKLRAPMFLIILTPFPIGMILLYLFLDQGFLNWALAYLLTLVIYTIIHIIVSALFRFHSLIPAWKLRRN